MQGFWDFFWCCMLNKSQNLKIPKSEINYQALDIKK
jgi:hypothetical protein